MPAATPVTIPVAVSILQTELGETANETAPPEGAVADKTKVLSIGKSLIVDGEITGALAVRAEVALTTCGELAAVFVPSPTIFVADTLIVYVPAVRPVNSAAAEVKSLLR